MLWNKYPVQDNASGALGFAGQSPKAGETTPTVSPQSGTSVFVYWCLGKAGPSLHCLLPASKPRLLYRPKMLTRRTRSHRVKGGPNSLTVPNYPEPASSAHEGPLEPLGRVYRRCLRITNMQTSQTLAQQAQEWLDNRAKLNKAQLHWTQDEDRPPMLLKPEAVSVSRLPQPLRTEVTRLLDNPKQD